MKSIGIDIGGTSIKGALFCDGTIVKTASSKTRGKEGRDKILNSLIKVIDELQRHPANNAAGPQIADVVPTIRCYVARQFDTRVVAIICR